MNEKALLRKIDLRIIPYVAFLYMLSFLDRVNIGNVHLLLKQELGLTESQYAICVGIFFVGYVLFELPSNLMMKRATPPVWIARILFSWGLISTLMAFCFTFEAIATARFFLGVAEAGFFPGIVYYLAFWYPPQERAFRIGLFYCTAALAGAFSGFLAYAILKDMDGIAGLQNWQWLFIIEGLPSILFSFVTWFYLPDFPAKASFLTEEERAFVIQRVKQQHPQIVEEFVEMGLVNLDDMGSSATLNEDGAVQGSPEPSNGWRQKAQQLFDVDALKKVLTSPIVWFFAFLYLALVIPFYSSVFFLPSFISQLGLSIIMSNLLTVPIYVLATISTLAVAWSSDRCHERIIHLTVCSFLSAFGFLGLTFWGHQSPPPSQPFQETAVWLAYCSSGLAVVSIFPTISCCLSWLTETMNRKSVDCDDEHKHMTTMAGATAIVVATGNIGGFVGPLIYSSTFNPEHGGYKTANAIMCGLLFAVCAGMAGTSKRKLSF